MSFSSEMYQGFPECRLILGLARGENKVSQACLVPGRENICPNNAAGRLKGHRSQLTRAPTGRTGHNLNIRTNQAYEAESR